MLATRRVRDHRGFSLVEALIAMGLLAGGLLALAQVVAAAVGATIGARNMSAAAVLAAQKVEEVRSVADAIGSTEYLDSTGVVVGTGAEPSSGAIYRRRWTIELLPVASAPRTIHVHVEPLAVVVGGVAGSGARYEAAHVVAVLARTP